MKQLDKQQRIKIRRDKESFIFFILLLMGIIAIILNPFSMVVTWTILGILNLFSSFIWILAIPIIFIILFLVIKTLFRETDIIPLLIISILFTMFTVGINFAEGENLNLVHAHMISTILGVITFILSLYFSNEIVDEPMTLPMFIGLLAVVLNVILMFGFVIIPH